MQDEKGKTTLERDKIPENCQREKGSRKTGIENYNLEKVHGVKLKFMLKRIIFGEKSKKIGRFRRISGEGSGKTSEKKYKLGINGEIKYNRLNEWNGEVFFENEL